MQKIETKKDTILSREVFYKKVENLINQTIENRENNKNYFKTNDSLNYYFSKFSPLINRIRVISGLCEQF